VSLFIIINPISGGAGRSGARARGDLAQRIVSERGLAAQIVFTERPGHARDLARGAAKRGDRAVVAWGGDGTINEVASALAFGTVPLAIVPAGSGNGLARELGISTRPERALATAIAGRTRTIDMGEVEGHLFVNLAGVGVDAHVASSFNGPENRRRGFLGYAGVTARTLVSYVPKQYRVTASNVTVTVRALLVTIANSAQFGNGARIAPGAQVDDGLLDLVVLQETSRLRTIAQIPRLFNGTIARIRGCTLEQVTEATIEADEPLTFHVDGEPHLGGPRLHARVHPAALRVIV
jgi:YegS/Rv2252/BmrU family lipid kinase